jgi:hypothetical protein
VLLEELLGKPGAQPRGAVFEDVGSLVPVAGRVVENRVEDLTASGDQITGGAGIIDQDAVAGEVDGVAGGRRVDRQAVFASEHAGGTDRQGIERRGLRRSWTFTGGQVEIEAAVRNPYSPGEQGGNQRGGVEVGSLSVF